MRVALTKPIFQKAICYIFRLSNFFSWLSPKCLFKGQHNEDIFCDLFLSYLILSYLHTLFFYLILRISHKTEKESRSISFYLLLPIWNIVGIIIPRSFRISWDLLIPCHYLPENIIHVFTILKDLPLNPEHPCLQTHCPQHTSLCLILYHHLHHLVVCPVSNLCWGVASWRGNWNQSQAIRNLNRIPFTPLQDCHPNQEFIDQPLGSMKVLMIDLICNLEIMNHLIGHGDKITKLVFQPLKVILVVLNELAKTIATEHVLVRNSSIDRCQHICQPHSYHTSVLHHLVKCLIPLPPLYP